MVQSINKVFWTDSFLLVFGENMNTDYHYHHALQISLCLNGPTTIDCENHIHTGDLVIIDSNKKHALNQQGLSLLILIDSELVEAKSLRCHLNFGDCHTIKLKDNTLQIAALELYNGTHTSEDAHNLFQSVVNTLIGSQHGHSHEIDSRITDAINIVKTDTSKAYTPEGLSKDVFLSLSRFQHLFKEQTGTTLSKFLLWQRTLNTIMMVSKGSRITDAALNAGFSDGAHFSKIIKRTFGITMTEVIKDSKNIEVIT